MLTETAIRHTKPKEKPYKLFDERGLFMLLAPTGGRLWRLPISVRWEREAARARRISRCALEAHGRSVMQSRRLVADGIAPNVQRQRDKATLGDTFEVVAREWLKPYGASALEPTAWIGRQT